MNKIEDHLTGNKLELNRNTNQKSLNLQLKG